MQREGINIYEFGPFRLDSVERSLSKDGRTVALPPKLFDILLLLLHRRGQLITKEELMRHVWPDQFVGDNNLTVRMSALRKTLDDGHGGHKYIETVPGEGYRFIARVKGGEAGGVESLPENAGLQRSRISSLAVLPFVNETGEPGLEYLSDGLTESVINSLSRLSHLRVIARSTVFSFKGTGNSPVTTGRKMGVDAVVVGRVIRLGDKLTVGVELVDVRDGTQIWGEAYNQRFSDLLEVQESIAREVAGKLSLRLTGEERRQLVKQHTANVEAYSLYLKGRYFWNRRTEKGINKGIQYFEEAIKLDANYALAYVGLSDCYRGLAIWNVVPPSAAYSLSRRYVTKALEIDGSLAEAYASLAIIELYDYDWRAAEKLFKLALELDPNYATAHYWYSVYLTSLGRFDEAIAATKLARNTDPFSLMTAAQLGKIYYSMRRYEQAVEQFDEIVEMDSTFATAHGMKGLVCIGMGRYEAAIASIQKADDLLGGDDAEAIALMGYGYGMWGKLEEASAALSRLEAQAQHRYIPPYLLSYIYTGLKEKDKTFECLEKAYLEHSYSLAYLKINPIYDDLRPDDRFTELLRRIGLTP
jgi:TolB-like protein